MKRYFAFVMAMVLVYMCLVPCFAITASADSMEAEESYVEVAALPMERDTFENVTWSQARSPQLNFGGLPANSSMLGARCRVTQGTTVLKVNYCTWDSERTISIGFFSLDDNNNYGVNYSSGQITSINITTENVPTGNYAVWVKNISNMKIISGILEYEVTG